MAEAEKVITLKNCEKQGRRKKIPYFGKARDLTIDSRCGHFPSFSFASHNYAFFDDAQLKEW